MRHRQCGQNIDRFLLVAVQRVDHIGQRRVDPRASRDASEHHFSVLDVIRPPLVIAEQVGDPGLPLALVADQVSQRLQRIPFARSGPVRGLFLMEPAGSVRPRTIIRLL